ncbi:MAG: retropepsin-like domain-containing protein, partial [Chromatiales bacterium]
MQRAPRQWCLTKTETVNTFENWRQNLVYTLSLDPNFAQFIATDAKWEKRCAAHPNRGFTDENDHTAIQQAYMLDLMLGQIANYCPVISRNTIAKNSTSLSGIWQTIRLHYGFQSTGAHFLDFADIHLQADERPEDLYQRLVAFVEDNMLQEGSVILHHGDVIHVDEEMSPSLENMVVLTWLRLINPALPKLIKQRYGTELRSRTLASIKPEISQALESLLDEIASADTAKVMRTKTRPNLRGQRPAFSRRQPAPSNNPRRPTSMKTCPLCKQVGRSDVHHFLSECSYLPEQDRRYMAKVRQVSDIIDGVVEGDDDTYEVYDERPVNTTTVQRIDVRQSPYLDAFHDHHAVRVTIDSGATGNMIRHDTAVRLGCTIKNSSQSAHQADGSSPLTIVGEITISLARKNKSFQFCGLVVQNLDVEMLAGTPFMEVNDITIRPAKRTITL